MVIAPHHVQNNEFYHFRYIYSKKLVNLSFNLKKKITIWFLQLLSSLGNHVYRFLFFSGRIWSWDRANSHPAPRVSLPPVLLFFDTQGQKNIIEKKIYRKGVSCGGHPSWTVNLFGVVFGKTLIVLIKADKLLSILDETPIRIHASSHYCSFSNFLENLKTSLGSISWYYVQHNKVHSFQFFLGGSQ